MGERLESLFVSGRIEKIAEDDRHAGRALLHRAAPQRLIEVRRAAGLELGQVFKKADRRLAAAHLPQLASQAQLIVAQRERLDGDAVEPAQRHVANGGGGLAGEVELGHLAK